METHVPDREDQRLSVLQQYSVGVSLSQNLEKRFDQDLDVKPEAPVIDVPQVQLHALGDIVERWRRAAGTIALCPAGYAWLHVMPESIVAENLFEITVVSQRMGAGTDQGHIPFQYVYQLGQFVNASRA